MCEREEALVNDAMAQRQLLSDVLKFNTIICPITTEPIESPVVMECRHVFEAEAVHRWRNTPNRGKFCPSCKGPFQIRADFQ
jgi:SUMO ligase MMS21 Smc5/6 complex component